jgi:hypothetical protein
MAAEAQGCSPATGYKWVRRFVTEGGRWAGRPFEPASPQSGSPESPAGARRADPAIWEVLPSSTRVVAEPPGKVESWPLPVEIKTPTRRGREGRESRRNTYRCGWYG